MKAKEIREMSSGEIKKFLEEKRARAVQLRFDISSKQLKNHREYRKVKRDIARAIAISKEIEIKK
ncbi:MAG: 50S ribosomal protein L29 [Candidatus Moranbacteria bacterium]|nr:50S ribosomal protein L29 [Candidatus Moranbacteria bacterium]